MRSSGVGATLDLVGRETDPAFASEVRRRADDLEITDHVRFVGELDDVHPYLRHIDVVVALSRGEWTPLALMEAMALGRPVVAATVGGVAEVIADGETGLLVPPEDPHRLARAILRIAADPSAAAPRSNQGAVVDGDDLIGRMGLREDRRQRRGDVPLRVVSRDNYSDCGGPHSSAGRAAPAERFRAPGV